VENEFQFVDHQILITFLRHCKYDLEKTKEKLVFYWTTKIALPEFYQNRNPEDSHIKNAIKSG
jgi:hypothetical protein